ncbi:MAG TPA: hydrogenase 4 subunit F [Bacteroidota bacterium]
MSIVLFSMLLGIPFLGAIICILTPRQRVLERVTSTGTGLTFLSALLLAREVLASTTLSSPNGFFYADALSAVLAVIVTGSAFATALYSSGYLNAHVVAGNIFPAQLRLYYALLNVFLFTMTLVLLSNNLGFLWIGTEATTLATAFLVAFYDTKRSLEAAWKYVIICSVGIALALFGVILTYFSSVTIAGTSSASLLWTSLMIVAKKLDPAILRLAYVFAFIGFGTKAGLAPMHTWKPDAYGEAPAPISGLMAGGLVNVALYSLIRFTVLVNRAVGHEFASTLLIVFGLGSIIVAIPFILLQRNIKRLLAYSSVEHVGIIVFAVGLASPVAYLGALLHMLNNAIVKLLLFFSAGNLRLAYHSKIIRRIEGAVHVVPFTATIFLIGVFAVTGWPPFGLFVSEFTIVTAGFSTGQFWPTIVFLLGVATIFAGFIYYAGKMAFGDSQGKERQKDSTTVTRILLAALAFLLLCLGIFIPAPLMTLLKNAATVMAG